MVVVVILQVWRSVPAKKDTMVVNAMNALEAIMTKKAYV
jgi:hypothetical protein